MTAVIQRIYLFIVAWFRTEPRPILLPEPPSLPAPPIQPTVSLPKSTPVISEENDFNGQFYFREAILDKLQYYMKCIARMRHADKEAYDLYSKVGANVTPDSMLIPRYAELSAWFRQTLPSFGAVFMGTTARDLEDKDNICVPRFMYFRKYSCNGAPPTIQRTNEGVVYVVTVYWDDVENRSKLRWCGKKGGLPQDYPFVVTPDGKVRLLRHRMQENVTIKHRHGTNRGKTSTVARCKWVDFDPWLKSWADEHKSEPEEYIVGVFTRLAGEFEFLNSSIIRVTATKGDLSAVFGVNVKRTPYFFKDRAIRLNHNGNRKRIFHMVRAHLRKTGAAIKFHFRGERSFNWNGYKVTITVPGKHHAHILDFNVGMLDIDKVKPHVKTIGTKELASNWQAHITEGKPIFGRAYQ